MLKKKYFLSILLLTFTIITAKTPLEPAENTSDRIDKNVALMEQIYTSITEKCDLELLKIYEKNIVLAINTYLENSLQTKKNKPENVKNEALQFLDYLIENTEQDDAYAIASILFMINLSKSVNKIVAQTENPQEKANLQAAIEKISALMEEIFLQPMAKMLEESE